MTETAVPAAVPTPPASAAVAPPARSSNLVGAGIVAVWIGLGGWLAVAGQAPHAVTFAFVMVGWLLAVMAHEFSHALVALIGGDHTVRAKGYLAFDPRRYGALQITLIIPLLAVALGGIGFPGGAVYLRNDLMRGRLWRAAAALAGPAATAAILLALALVLRVGTGLGGAGGDLWPALSLLAFLQAMALMLNLVPIPGLDGFNALRSFLPFRLGPAIRKAEALAPLALLAAIFFVPGCGATLFRAAAGLCRGLGVSGEAMQTGWNAFHFWR